MPRLHLRSPGNWPCLAVSHAGHVKASLWLLRDLFLTLQPATSSVVENRIVLSAARCYIRFDNRRCALPAIFSPDILALTSPLVSISMADGARRPPIMSSSVPSGAEGA